MIKTALRLIIVTAVAGNTLPKRTFSGGHRRILQLTRH
jgi:hypothetical protein